MIDTTTGRIQGRSGYVPSLKQGLLWGPVAFSPDGSTLARVSLEGDKPESRLELYKVQHDGSFEKVDEKKCPDFSSAPLSDGMTNNQYWPFSMVWASGDKPFYSLCRGMALQRWNWERTDWENLLHYYGHTVCELLPVSGGQALVRVQSAQEQQLMHRFLVVNPSDKWHMVVAWQKDSSPDIYAVSPDLKYVAFGTWQPGRTRGDRDPKTLWLVRLSNGKMVKLLYSEPGVMSAAFSPDGRKLACFSWCRSGQMDRVVLTRAYLDVIDLDGAYERMRSSEPLPYDAKIHKVLGGLGQFKTWSYEEAPVMTLEEVKAFAYDREKKNPKNGSPVGAAQEAPHEGETSH
jgi:hypothetical protein